MRMVRELAFEDLFAEPLRNGIYKKKEFHGAGVPIFNMGNLFSADRLRERPTTLVDVSNDELERFSLRKGDLLFGRRSLVLEGSGKCSIVDEVGSDCVFESSLIRVRLDPDKADPEYYFRFFSSPEGRHRVLSIASQTAVSGIRGSDLARLPVPVPPIGVQHRIGAALRSFDDRIENNRRRIAILEEIARLIYQEWFVHFRFPGNEGNETINSEARPVPRGWEVRPVEGVCEVMGGGTPSRKNDRYWEDGPITWYTPSDLTSNNAMFAFDSTDHITEAGLAKSSAKLFPAGSVMMTSRATVGVVAISATEACTNQGFIVCLPSDDLSSYHLYFWLRDNVNLFLSLASGATFKELRRSTFRQLPIIVPPRDLERRFVERVGPMCELVSNLLRQNQVLVRARDLLLPRLVSGELDVSGFGLDLETVG